MYRHIVLLIVAVMLSGNSELLSAQSDSTGGEAEDREVERAMALLANGEYDQFIAALRSSAEMGNVKAQVLLGHTYEHENVAIKKADYSEAMKWFRRASGMGSGEASAAIAELYEQGLGVPKSEPEAAAWWELATKQGYDQQELDVRCFVRILDRSGLTCESSENTACPTDREMNTLQKAGVTGRLKFSGGGPGRFRRGPKARAIIVLDHSIATEQRLRQPRHTSVIYIQRADSWELLPQDAPLLERQIVLSPQSDYPQNVLAGVQDVDGSTSAGSCVLWPSSN